MLRSRNTSNGSHYQPVETSEYEVLEHEGLDPDPGGLSLVCSFSNSHSHISFPDFEDWPSSRRGSRPSVHEDDLVHTVSREDSTALSHPTPETRSFTRTHLANIERLEESAQRLSLSEDIAEELRKLQDKQKYADSRKSSVRAARQFSTTSQPSSIVNINRVARSGGFSPEAYVASPVGSIASPWSAQSAKTPSSIQKMDSVSKTSEPAKEGRPLDLPTSPDSKVLRVRNSTSHDELDLREKNPKQELSDNRHPERPNSAASGDTFKRAHDAFADFDGVHIQSNTPELDKSNSLLDPNGLIAHTEHGEPVESYLSPNGNDQMNEQIPLHQEDMVYYPAPIPMMLNLPAKLSKRPRTSQLAKRRSELLQTSNKSRQSLLDPHSNEEQIEDTAGEAGNRSSKLPPQLRASLFFDQTPVNQSLEITGGSAVQTLDRLLDASAFAPVAAFTDHPMAGREGGEIYSNKEEPTNITPSPAKRPTLEPPKTKRRGSSFFAFGAKLRGVSKPAGEEEAVEAEEPQAETDDEELHEEEEEEEDQGPIQRPSTLLAELQIRKAQQKQRNRTAANAYPNGMHSTLLELDAVAQVQKQARKHKQISLAWEDDKNNGEDDPDEDIPLGLLFPGGQRQANETAARYPEDKPLGLLAQRNLEESEPLSSRKSRLYGTNSESKLGGQRRSSTLGVNKQAMAHLPPQEEEEEETLGQRRRRLKGEPPGPQARPLSSEFASEVLSQLGGVGALPTKKHVQSKTPDPEETLGQRRKRLQAEKEARQASGQSTHATMHAATAKIQKRGSMADLLQSNPIGLRQVSNPNPPATSSHGLLNNHQNRRHASTWQQPVAPQHPNILQRSRTDIPQHQSVQYPNPMVQYAQYAGGYAPMVYPPPITEQLPAMPPQQRAIIDRWRQGIA